MDRARAELKAVEATLADAFENEIQQLDELQLALVGGGIADPILH